ncbi:MAG: cardiolipin synthase [Synergistaceae bacterium]|nr:cardiolipin synthase [Synergistaceae bacterium]
MWKMTKIVLFMILAAFITGLMPTIIDFMDRTVIYSVKEGLSLHPQFTTYLSSFFSTAKKYTWHIVIAYAFIIGIVIFMEGQNPDRTILWLLTLVLVPVVGVIVYMIIGPDLKNIKKRKLFKPAKGLQTDKTPFTKDKRFLMGMAMHATSGADLTTRNRVDILINGDATFDSIKSELRKAKRFIHMQYYIIKDDKIGVEIRDILTEAVSRGVKVRVLYDAVGSWKLKREYIETLKEAGVDCHSFMPVSFPMFRRKMNFRNHRKIIVIDERVAFTGGINIGDEYLGKGHLGHWRDTHVRLEGEAVDELHKIFLYDWCMRSGEDPKKICDYVSCDDCDGVSVQDLSKLPFLPLQVVASGIDNAWHSISIGYFSMISRAKERVWITSPYLVPGPILMNAMTTAALAGVDVRVLMPSQKDHFLVFWGSRGNIELLLRAGVRVYHYKKGFIHAKAILADHDMSSVGTCNMDVRSLEINFENQLFIYDKGLNSKFAEQFIADIGDSVELILNEWEKRPLWQKILESFGRLYSAQI